MLADNPEDTIDVVAIGPLTTIAQAAAADPVTFLRARRLVVMGGALRDSGNITPLAEFNFYADPLAAARVLALTSPLPATTMPSNDNSGLQPYPSASNLGSRRLNMVLFPLDITHQNSTVKADYLRITDPLVEQGSPLAEWLSHVYLGAVAKMADLNTENVAVALHDPMCVWYTLQEPKEQDLWTIAKDQDIRVETAGQWALGASFMDRRDRKKIDEVGLDEANLAYKVGDEGGWLSPQRGNRVGLCTRTPGPSAFTNVLLTTIFGGH